MAKIKIRALFTHSGSWKSVIGLEILHAVFMDVSVESANIVLGISRLVWGSIGEPWNTKSFLALQMDHHKIRIDSSKLLSFKKDDWLFLACHYSSSEI